MQGEALLQVDALVAALEGALPADSACSTRAGTRA